MCSSKTYFELFMWFIILVTVSRGVVLLHGAIRYTGCNHAKGEQKSRLVLEQVVLGRSALNAIACEGLDRVWTALRSIGSGG